MTPNTTSACQPPLPLVALHHGSGKRWPMLDVLSWRVTNG
jgi:hypothetical protein